MTYMYKQQEFSENLGECSLITMVMFGDHVVVILYDSMTVNFFRTDLIRTLSIYRTAVLVSRVL